MNTADWSTASWRKSSFSGNTGGACIEVADIAWRTSSYSGGTGGNCVEVGDLTWRKSSRSTNTGGNCVEVGAAAAVVAVRDSKDPDGPKLLLSAAAWTGLLDRAGR
ncbi:DUF397 domain-containing protein [Actinomadura oligospora]|uniref:DUF397 domain-containing protein n=1 Tax=Actinomadura oligospora TaxID=111804 RepID=UPI0009FBDC79|nr:DUF397 domain-containing protein [Actinomadura oligospora]